MGEKFHSQFNERESREEVHIVVESTPNPQSLKFTLNCPISEDHWEVDHISQAGRSPLAQKILGFPWAKKIFIGTDFITISKEDWVDWEILEEPLSQLIKEHVIQGESVLLPEKSFKSPENTDRKNSDIVNKIKQILQQDIQPAVAVDGGFISFAGYKEGTVFLKMQGACAGCPSSSLTLKQGVESHLKSLIPEVQEVIAL